MAVVYAGWHEQLDRPVALKVLAEHLAGDKQFRARFLARRASPSKLHHPNLVQTYDIAELDGRPCIVMELLPWNARGWPLHARCAAEVAAGARHAPPGRRAPRPEAVRTCCAPQTEASRSPISGSPGPSRRRG